MLLFDDLGADCRKRPNTATVVDTVGGGRVSVASLRAPVPPSPAAASVAGLGGPEKNITAPRRLADSRPSSWLAAAVAKPLCGKPRRARNKSKGRRRK
jgi:hypothetical protein